MNRVSLRQVRDGKPVRLICLDGPGPRLHGGPVVSGHLTAPNLKAMAIHMGPVGAWFRRQRVTSVKISFNLNGHIHAYHPSRLGFLATLGVWHIGQHFMT